MTALITTPAANSVYQIRPLQDPRWDEFVLRSPKSSAFHTRAWLEALHLTYGYEPVAYTLASPHLALDSALVFCRVNSWLTGRRLVSLPFSDHCAPLVRGAEELQQLFSAVEPEVSRDGRNYLELRQLESAEPASSLACSRYTYCLHQLNLRPELNQLFQGFHKSCTQRMIRRAERVGLRYEEGTSASLIDEFYRLFLIMRRRKRVPPPPKFWFENLAACLGDRLKIRVASQNGEVGAAMMTIRHNNTLLYKYGSSDPRFHSLGAMQFLFWRCIEDAKREGIATFDMGRSNLSDSGLIAFKDRWGCTRSTLTYSRYGRPGRFEYRPDGAWLERAAKKATSYLPESLFAGIGRLIYPHIG